MDKTTKNVLIGIGLYLVAKKTGVLKSVGIGGSKKTNPKNWKDILEINASEIPVKWLNKKGITRDYYIDGARFHKTNNGDFVNYIDLMKMYAKEHKLEM